MESPKSLTFAEVRRLGHAALLLQDAARRNEEDEERAAGGAQQFIYFVDPAVAIWYCQPWEQQNLSGFEVAGDANAATGAGSALTVSLLTLSFIFSGAKPGASALPTFFSPQHIEEFTRTIERDFAPQRSAVALDHERLSLSHRALKQAVEDLQRLGQLDASATDEQIEAVFDSVNEILEQPVEAASFSKDRLIELFARNMIVSLQRYSHLLDDEGAIESAFEDLDERRVAQWRGWLEAASPREHLTENVNRDAETLSALERLNDRFRGRPQALAFLFITSDRAVHEAMKSCLASTEVSPGQNSFVRHPRQYAPIFNLNSTPTRVPTSSEFFFGVKRAILDLASTWEPFALHSTAQGSGSEEVSHTPDPLQLAEQATTLREEWFAAMRTAALLNVDVLSQTTQSGLRAAMEVIDADLARPDVNDILVSQIRLQTERMLRSNRAFAIRGLLLDTSKARRARRSGISGGRRLPIMFDFPIPGEVLQLVRRYGQNPRSIADLIEWLANEIAGKAEDFNREFEELVDDMRDVDAYAFATAVAFRGRGWSAALHFSSACLDAIRQSGGGYKDLRREVAYCGRVAERFLFRTLPDFQRLRKGWELALLSAGREHDSFARARANAELAALGLVLVFRAKRLLSPRLGQDYVRDVLTDCLNRTNLGIAIVDNEKSKDRASASWRGVEEQLRSNKVTCYVFLIEFFNDTVTDSLRGRARVSLDELTGFNSSLKRVHTIPALYSSYLEFVLASHSSRARALSRLADALGEARESGSLQGNLVDAALFDWFLELQQKANSIYTTGS